MITKYNNGYVALVTVLFTAAVLSMLIASNGLLVWNSQQHTLQMWAKKQSTLLADSCVRLAALQLKALVQPAAQTVLSLQDSRCTIVSIEAVNATWNIRTSATVLGAKTNLLATVDGSSFAVTMESEPP